MPATDPVPEAPKFGTSGLRGLVTSLTPELVARHVAGFVVACDAGQTVLVGEDLRASSPDIARVAAQAVAAAGAIPVRLGALPTPALALAARAGGAGAVMVTGSHIPADRNGLKFYTRGGAEITKEDEVAITAAAEGQAPHLPPAPQVDAAAGRAALDAYAARYPTAFGPDALEGMTLGLYQHSSVARDLMADVFTALGARVVPLGRSEHFVPVDTEAVSPETRAALEGWADGTLDAILSTDGDADRPLLADADGRVIAGDLLGGLAARLVGATRAVTPVSSTTALERMEAFDVARTRIGSPFVIAGMEAALARDPDARVVGFEANGGFLLGFDARLAGPLPALPTRDAMLPLVAPLVLARREGTSLAGLVAGLPARFTAADRLQGIDRPAAEVWLDSLATDPQARGTFLGAGEAACDLTDGVRMTRDDGGIVHLRLSGNAPELRVYAEADSVEAAGTLVAQGAAQAEAALA